MGGWWGSAAPDPGVKQERLPIAHVLVVEKIPFPSSKSLVFQLDLKAKLATLKACYWPGIHPERVAGDVRKLGR